MEKLMWSLKNFIGSSKFSLPFRIFRIFVYLRIMLTVLQITLDDHRIERKITIHLSSFWRLLSTRNKKSPIIILQKMVSKPLLKFIWFLLIKLL